MDYQINFPNLGIYLSHVPKSFSVGRVEIALYGVMIAVGMTLGIAALMRRAKETGQDPEDYLDIAVFTMLFAIAGARIYYVVFSWDLYRDSPLSVFNIREGGLAIYGGIIAGVITVAVLARVKKKPFPLLLDTCVIGVPIGQILGRWGNFFNREAFGGYTDGLFAMQLPVSAVRAEEVTSAMWENVVIRGGVRLVQVHPTFLYEGFWNLGVLLLLFLLRNRTKFSGELFLVYVLGYGTGRFLIEPLRTDQLLIPGTTVPVSMVLSAAAAAAAGVLILLGRRKNPSKI